MPITVAELRKLRHKPKHKFGAKPCKADGIHFPSKLERYCYESLKSLQKCGTILFFLRQVPFDIPGGHKHFVDFLIFTPNQCHFVEAKGRDLAVGKLKREQVEDLYGIDIFVVHNASELCELVLKNL